VANFVFVSYAGYPYSPSSLCPDNGLGILAAVLRQAGHNVRILDFGTVDTMRRLYPEKLSHEAAPLLMELAQAGPQPGPALVQRLGELDHQLEQHQAAEVQDIAHEVVRSVGDIDPAFVGFKLWNGDGFTGSVTIAEALRRACPDLAIYAGGPQTTWAGPAILERTGVFDALVLGEGEDKVLALAEAAMSGKPLADVAGVVVAADTQTCPTGTVNIDETPRAIYDEDVYPAMSGDQKLKMIVLDDSRGCPYGCAFCMHSYESGRVLRTRSAAHIVDDMESVIEQHGIRTFRFAGSSTPGSLMADVAREIKRRRLKVLYTSFAHFDNSLPEYYELMRASGLYSMFFGLETGSEALLKKATGKPIKLEYVREAVSKAKAAGITVACSMIVPMPFETQETLDKSYELLAEIRPDSVPLQFPGLLPGTRWFQHPERFNFEFDRENFFRENLDYKFKMLFPPSFWKPLSYKVNGMSFHEFTQITAQFAGRLEAAGILTGVPDENLMMAHVTGMSPREFRDRARFWCAAGDVPAMQRFVAAYNDAATSESLT